MINPQTIPATIKITNVRIALRKLYSIVPTMIPKVRNKYKGILFLLNKNVTILFFSSFMGSLLDSGDFLFEMFIEVFKTFNFF